MQSQIINALREGREVRNEKGELVKPAFDRGEGHLKCYVNNTQFYFAHVSNQNLYIPSCDHACSPSDFYKGGKCDKMGCYNN